MIKRTTALAEYVKERGKQAELARNTGYTDAAIYHMIKADRTIFVIENTDGSIELEERKRLASED